MTPEEMRRRTRAFALRVVKLAEALPRTRAGDIMARQLIRCGTSVAANYRAAGRGRSHAEFTSKIGIVEEESDETVFWLEFVVDAGLMTLARAEPLIMEGREILAIVTASRKTAQANRRR